MADNDGDSSPSRCRCKSKTTSDNTPPANFFPVAVVGIGCRMPGDVDSPESFWEVIRDGKDVVAEILPERWNVDHFHDPDHTKVGKHCMRRIGMIKDIDKFDNSFFKISPREALTMDPQQRHLLEVTHEAFEDAGVVADDLGADGGVFVGIGLFDYSIYITDPHLMDPYVLTGSAHSCAANRLSFAFDLKGPSYACDTACASGLTALHLALTSLWNKECTTAVVGACNAILIPEVAIGFSQLGVVSADGMSRPFSKTANGYVRSEGWGTVILKPLDRAIRDNDHVYCTIHGTAIAANGNYNSLTMPSPLAQEWVMGEAYRRFGLDRSQVDYVEAHGTGTPVGDPIEANAIGNTFAPYRESPLRIGSVKSNFGHQECCSGIASLIKIALMFDKKYLCPTINFEGINPEIDLGGLKLRIQQTVEAIPPNTNFTIGLNSFGFAGALAHAVFREAPGSGMPNVERGVNWTFGGLSSGEYTVVPLTGRCDSALTDLARKWLTFEHEKDALTVVSWLSTRRKHFECKLAILANSGHMFRERLRTHLDGGTGNGIFTGSNYGTNPPKICFIFPGQGQQWGDMGRRLYYTEEVFREAVDRCDALFRQLSGWSVLADKDIFNGIHSEHVRDQRSDDVVDEMDVAQPAIFFLQIGLYELLKHWGVRPDVCVGHSLGEVAAAYACGGLSLEQAVMVIYHRSQQQLIVKGKGSMAAVRMTLSDAQSLCRKYTDLEVAAVNGQTNIAIAGNTSHIREICNGYPSIAKELRVQCAFHSSYMDSMRVPFLEAMGGFVGDGGTGSDRVPLYSTVSGEKYDGAFSKDYWWDNIRGCVYFHKAVTRVIQDEKPDIFLELAASSTLLSSIKHTGKASNTSTEAITIPCGRRKTNDRVAILSALSELYVSGVKISWKNVTHEAAEWVRLPAYPWQRQSFWLEADYRRMSRLALGEINFKSTNGRVSLEEFSFLADHVVQGKIVFPGAGLIDYICQMCFPERQRVVLTRVCFVKALFWPEKAKMIGDKTQVHLAFERKGDVVVVCGDGKKICSAEIDNITPNKCGSALPIDRVLAKCLNIISAEKLYARFGELELGYGPAFQPIEKLHTGDMESIGYLKPVRTTGQFLDISTLDGCFQVLLAALGGGTTLYIPVKIESLQVFCSSLPLGKPLLAYAKIRECDSLDLTGDITLADSDGSILIEIIGCQCKNISGTHTDVDLNSCLYATEWQPSASRLPSTALLQELFREDGLREEFPEEMRSVDSGEESLEVLRRASLSYIRHALAEVPQAERSVSDRFNRRLHALAALDQESLPMEDLPSCLDAVSKQARGSKIECDMIKSLGENLPSCLRDPSSSFGLLFSFIEDYFDKASSIDIYYVVIARLLTRAVLELSKTKSVIRILEIGGRLGGFAKHLLENLKELGDFHRVQYILTDVSQTFFEKAKENLAEYQFVEYELFDFQNDPELQGFVPKSVDIIISIDAVHAVSSLDVAVGHLRQLLCDGGWLVVMETTKGNICQDLIFGCLDLCWNFDDFRSESCWMAQSQWVSFLSRSGFDDVLGCSTPNEYFHSVMLGCKSKQRITAPSIKPEHASRWLLLSDRSQDVFVHHLQEYIGPPLYHASDMHDTTTVGSVLQSTQCSLKVVYVWSQADANLHSLLGLLQTVYRHSDMVSRVWVVTAGASVECSNADAHQAVGLARAANNFTSVQVTSIDLDRNSPPQEGALILARFILDPDSVEGEIAVRDEETMVPRLMPLKLNRETASSQPKSFVYWRIEQDNVATDHETTSSFDSLGFVSHHDMTIEGDEVLVEVRAAALNFKDVMIGLGMLDELQSTEDGVHLGLECAGTVQKIGSDITGYQIGDEVLGFGGHCLASHAICKGKLLVMKPAKLPWTEAAGLGIVFVAAYYSLVRKANLQPGETVLIHSACGGLGLAAIQIAKMTGAEIIATAGTAEKRTYLQDSLGIKYVTDSRSDRFYVDVMRWTHGRGVDVVLNSLSGNLLAKGVALLASEGRFCEVGKRDILGNSAFQMRPLLGNVSILSCQVDGLIKSNPRFVGSMLGEIVTMIEAGNLQPIVSQVHDITDVRDVFRTMAQGKHIGKFVFEMKPFSQLQPDRLTLPSKLFKPSTTYLITGGNGGIGQAMSRWLYANGARHIALVSRSGSRSASSKCTVSYLKKRGVRVYQFECDLSDQADTSKMLADLRVAAPPLNGLFHLAGVITDESSDSFDLGCADTIMGSKAVSARHLHQLTLTDNLDTFFLLSSICTTWGHAAQPCYVAANAYLDALATHRRNRGLPGLSVQLGPIRGAGYLEGKPETARIFASKGNHTLHVLDFLKMLKTLIGSGCNKPVICLANQDWSVTMQYCHRNTMTFRHLTACDSKPSNSAPSPSGITADGMEVAVKNKLGQLLFLTAESIDVNQPMINYGVDSLMAVEIVTWASRVLRVSISQLDVLSGITTASLLQKASNV